MRTYLFILLSFCFATARGQNILILETPNVKHRITFVEGSIISFRLNGNKNIQSGKLMHIKDSTIVVYNDEFQVSDISHIIDLDKRVLVRIFSKVSIIGGIGFFGVNTVNRLINDETPYITSQSLIISGSLIAAGFLLKPFSYKQYRISKRQPLKILVLN